MRAVAAQLWEDGRVERLLEWRHLSPACLERVGDERGKAELADVSRVAQHTVPDVRRNRCSGWEVQLRC